MRRLLRILPLGALLLAGCFSRDTAVHLRPDGSGEVVVETTVSEPFLRYLRGMTGGSPKDWFTEAALRDAALSYGEGVSYRSHEVVEEEAGKTFRAVYAFDDVTRLRIGLDVSLPFLPTSPDRSTAYPPFSFESSGGGRFAIRPPPAPPVTSGAPRVRVESARARQQREARHREDLERLMRHGNPFGLSRDATPEVLIRTLTKGMSFRLRVVPEGVVTASNARYTGEEGVLLFDARVPEALEDEAFMTRAKEGNLSTLTWSELVEAQGVRAETGERVLLYLREEEGGVE